MYLTIHGPEKVHITIILNLEKCTCLGLSGPDIVCMASVGIREYNIRPRHPSNRMSVRRAVRFSVRLFVPPSANPSARTCFRSCVRFSTNLTCASLAAFALVYHTPYLNYLTYLIRKLYHS